MMASLFKSKNIQNINAVVIAASTQTPEELSEVMAKYGMQVSDSACADKVFKMAVKTKNVTALGTLVKLKVEKTVLILALFECVEADFHSGVEVLVSAGVDVNVTDLKGNTALMIAVKRRSMNCVQYLLEMKADANLVNKSKHTALSLACKNGQSGIVEKLVQFGAFWDTSKATNVRQYNDHLITCAKLMKKCSAHSVNSRDGRGYTLLMYAAQTGCAKTVRVLLSYSADVNQLDHKGATALMHVFKEYLRSSLPVTNTTQTISIECVQLLCGESVSIQDKSGQTALVHALVSKKDISEEIITCLVGRDLSCYDRYYKTALIYAAQYKPLLIKALFPYLDNKARLYQDRGFKTALMHYLRNSKEIELDVVRYLFANSNASDLCGYTELMHAVETGSEDCVKLLVSLGAEVESTDSRKRTALMLALGKEMSPDCLKCLIGRSINMEDKIGQTALAYARKSRDVEFLIQNGADLMHRDVNKQTILMKSLKNIGHACSKEIMSLLIPCGVNAQDVHGRTVLMYAAVSNPVFQIKDLVAFGADVNLQDSDGLTALMMSFLRFNFRCELVEILKGKDINIRDTKGNTALLHAVATYQCSPTVFRKLARHGANIHEVNLKGDSFFTLLVNTPSRRDFYSTSNYRGNVPSDLYMSNKINRNKNLFLDEGETHFMNAALKKHLSNRSACFIKACQKPNVLRVLLSRGIVPNHIFYLPETCNDLLKEYLTMKLKQEPAHLTFYRISPLVTTLVLGYTHVAKYLLANTCLELTDISELQKLQTLPVFSKISPQARSLISEVTSNPWPLVKLAFLALSTCVGFDVSRVDRVNKIDIYPRIKKLLVFNTQTSRIPTRQWGGIRLSFKHEDLDKMRPILSTWPMAGLEV